MIYVNSPVVIGKSGGDCRLQAKIATPTTSFQEIIPDEKFDGLSRVTVEAVTSAIDSNIQPQYIKKDTIILGVIGTFRGSDCKQKEIIDRTVTTLTIEDFNGISKIGRYAFYDCVRLNSVELPDSITYIGERAFVFTPISRVNVEKTIAYVGKFLINIYWQETILRPDEGIIGIVADNNPYRVEELYCPSTLKYIGGFTFGNELRVLVLNEGLEYIEGFAFNSCNFKNLNLPSTLLRVQSKSFINNLSLLNITINNNTEFEYIVFTGCNNIESVTINSVTPPQIQDDTFPNVQEAPRMKFYVPTEAVETYKTATNWVQYADIIFPIGG